MMEDKLQTIIERNQDSVLGRDYGFDSIATAEQFAERVPLCDSDSMAKYLEMTYENPHGKVMASDPVVWYLMSSGTTGTPKKIPITKLGMKDTSTGSMYGWLSYMNASPGNDSIIDGTMVTFGAPAVLDYVNGIPVGYASGVYGEHQNAIFKRLIKPGPDIFNITENERKMWEYAKIIATSKTTVIQGITTLGLALIRRLQDMYGPMLLDEYRGTKHESRINGALNDDGKLDIHKLCPHLKMLGSSGIDVGPYREWLESTVPGLKVWEFYGISEVGIVGVQTMNEPGIQLLGNLNYMEFIPAREAEKPYPTVKPLSEVTKGERYELVVTSINGWYRYRPGDLLTFTDIEPYTVKAIARKGRVVNLAGEKISEAHVQRAIKAASQKTGASVMDFTVVGVIEDGLGHYVIAVMLKDYDIDAVEFVLAFEDSIMENNNEFRVVRESGALGPTTLVKMKSSYSEDIVRETHLQAKPIPLTNDSKILAICEEY
jgi:acyl-CoA synthetase (AMP-forming)/AMP-acid ligase II